MVKLKHLKEIEEIIHADQKAIFIVSSNPLALGVLTPPGKLGADIVAGDAQPFGIPECIWWSTLWLFCGNEKLMRKVPGRFSW